MTRLPRMPWIWACLLLAVAGGCADNPMVLTGKLDRVEKEKQALTAQNQVLQQRVDAAARDNEQLHQNIAREQQQVAISEKMLQEKNQLLREKSQQLAQALEANKHSEEQVRHMNASLRRDGGVTIQPNTTALQEIRIQGVQTRQDGDVVRIELPCASLFAPGGNQIRPDSVNWLCGVAMEIARYYPDQRIGIEGNTDNAPVAVGTNQELSVARAMAVYNVLITKTRLQPNQLIVVGHGANNPIVSNGTPSGRARNNRIEFVVYPQRRPN